MAAPTATCSRCGKTILFDGFIRNAQGVCIPHNPDYSRHLCYDRTLTKSDVDDLTINHIQTLVEKYNKGLYHHRIKLVVETAEPAIIYD